MFRTTSVLLLVLCSSHSWAERTLLSGELGLWLTQTAIPELTETLARHPKFSGEPIRIAAVDGSQTSTRSTVLADAIRQQLTHAVLRMGKNDVANNHDPALCNKVPQPVYYLVGIQIEPVSRSKHRVNLAVLDLENSMWVSGISLTWQGRLLSSELAALAAQLQNAPAGSVDNPLQLNEPVALTNALYAQLQCRLPRDLDGSLSSTTPQQQALQLVLHDVQDRLALSAQAVTRDTEQASWLLHAELQPVASGLQLLSVSLRHKEATTPGQRLASLYISGQRHHPTPVYFPDNEGRQLLSALSVPDPGQNCRNEGCTEVAFDLHQDAYLLVFSTQNGSVTPVYCGYASNKKTAGEQRYRLRTTADQRVGFYVIASRERQAVRTLQQHVRKAPGACKQPSTIDPAWLPRTLASLTELKTAIEWRAVHLINTPQGVQVL